MKHRTVIVPMRIPKLSDAAAVQLLEILRELIATVEHHYGPQIQRRRRRQRDRQPPTTTHPPSFDLPF